jgi:hypothetical protein
VEINLKREEGKYSFLENSYRDIKKNLGINFVHYGKGHTPKKYKEKINQFYRRDPFFVLIFNRLDKRNTVLYYLRFWSISIILYSLIFITSIFYYNRDPMDFFYYSLTGPTFMLLMIMLPLTLIFMNYIYQEYLNTFLGMENFAIQSDDTNTLNKEKYENFMKWNYHLFQDRRVLWLYLVTSIIVIFISVVSYIYPSGVWARSITPSNRIAILIVDTLAYEVAFIMIMTIMTIVWHLFTIVVSIRRYCGLPFKIKPTNPDKAGGLRPFANLTFKMEIVPIIAIINVSDGIFIGRGQVISAPYLITFVAISAAVLIIFFFPLTTAHTKMKSQKDIVLTQLSEKYNMKLQELMQTKDVKGDVTDISDDLNQYQALYQKAQKMPVWPFDVNILSRVSSVELISILIPLIGYLAGF